MTYSVIDLFAGAGGLSLGFKQLKNYYTVKAFVENNPAAKKTYLENNHDVIPYDNVIKLDYNKVKKDCGGKIDIVIGGPPCQGFSNANRQHNELVNMNNQLVKEYVRAICELKPKAFVMENVQMLKSDVHVFFCTIDDRETNILDDHKIKTKPVKRILLDDDYYSQELFDICQKPELLKAISLPHATISILNNVRRYVKNPVKLQSTFVKYQKEISNIIKELTICNSDLTPNSIFNDNKILSKELKKYAESTKSNQLIPALQKVCAVQHLIKDICELYEKQIYYKLEHDKGIKAVLQAYSVSEYITNILSSDGYKMTSGVLNAAEFGVPQKRQRFIIIGVKDTKHEPTLPVKKLREDEFQTVRDAIGDLENITATKEITEGGVPIRKKNYPAESLRYFLCNSKKIYNHTCTNTRDVALARFAVLKQGQNFHDLSDELKLNTYTDISRTQNTIYQRLKYDCPSGTVLNVRKSMWIHPTLDRALSIREAARLQTFPDSYIFYGTKDNQYQQIGNAVPPILSKAIAEHLLTLL